MKKGITIGILAATIVSVTACKDMKDNAPMEEAMKDSVFKAIDEARYTGIKVLEHQDVTVTIGSQKLFDGTEERRQEVVTQLAAMTVYYFEENNYLDEGKVVFVPDERTIPTDESPRKEYDMHLETLIKK